MSSIARSSAADTNGRCKKMRKKMPSPTTEPRSILSLPNDLLLNCLARVSRLYYPILSLVSKKFRSIIASSELYKIRSYLNRTESCLYLCLRFPLDPIYAYASSELYTYWFTLCRTPNRGNLLVPVPSPDLPPAASSSIVAVGSDIYKIGGNNEVPSCRVSVLDCKSNKWHKAPSMGMDRGCDSTATLLDGKIYVAGGCKDLNSSSWVEVFDPKTQTWRSVRNPGLVKSDGGELKSLGFEGKFYVFGDKFAVYNPEEDRWITAAIDTLMACALVVCSGVIDGVLFIWNDEVFRWYDVKASLWKTLNGVTGLPRFGNCLIVDVGGKMMVLWDESVDYSENVIWCAEISLERRSDGDEIWGKVEWVEAVLLLHKFCRLLHGDALSATV